MKLSPRKFHLSSKNDHQWAIYIHINNYFSTLIYVCMYLYLYVCWCAHMEIRGKFPRIHSPLLAWVPRTELGYSDWASSTFTYRHILPGLHLESFK